MLRFDLNLVWTIVNLLILYVLIRKFLFQPVYKILEARQAEIDKQYADAKKVQEDAASQKAEYEQSMTGIAKEKAEVLNEARNKAGEEYKRILEEARQQADKLLADAKVEVEREQEKSLQQAQTQIADLVVAATAKIVASKNNEEEDRELYNQFIAKTRENAGN